jgi:alpha-ketoglutarate-dependent taurine dioxygenase
VIEGQVLSRPVVGPKAWRADSVRDGGPWSYPLPEGVAGDLCRLARGLAAGDRPLVETRLPEADRAAWAGAFRPVRDELENGRGFAIVEGPPGDALSASERMALYWVVGQLLGTPFAQNVEGTLLYDVRDYGRDVSQGARFSVTSAESSFHTDNSFGEEVLDYVGLLCLRTAKTGGLSQQVSGLAAHNELLATDPEALETLYRPFHVDRRGGVRPGESPTIRQPVIERDGDELIFRYLRYWIEAGHQKAGEPLSDAQSHALDALDRALNRPELRAEFMLSPGDMYFINNRWILHNRTAFEDHDDPDRRRHYVRLWLKARPDDGRAA